MESPLSFCRGDEATTTWGVDPWQHDAALMRSPNQGEVHILDQKGAAKLLCYLIKGSE